MVAYACNPSGGGEHWLGWKWAEEAARHFNVDLITTAHSRGEVLTQAEAIGIKPHFIELPRWQRRLSERLGSAGSWMRKSWWQFPTARLARKLHAKAPFALTHQTTFHSFRVPFRTAMSLHIPAVWGPLAGGESVP